MAGTPGLLAMPGTLLNAALGLLPDRTVAVQGPLTLSVVIPMYNEERGAGHCISALLRQETPPDQIAISINGGRDDTRAVVTAKLRQKGYGPVSEDDAAATAARVEQWRGSPADPPVLLVTYAEKTAKAESVNNLAASGLLSGDRILVVDGDTVLHPRFVTELSRNFYRLRQIGRPGRRGWVLEEYPLVSGSVRARRPRGPAGAWQRLISSGRRAEYATSTLLRRGQARQAGDGPVFGTSRVFTVVGCGFAASREHFPMPVHSRTEDHEFTLRVQNSGREETVLTPEELGARGFRLGSGADSRALTDLIPPGSPVRFRRAGTVRFVPEATMLTEDPATAGGFLNQVERWNGGGQEGALKRLGTRLRPNVAWTVWLAQAESLTGIFLLLLLLPNMVALNFVNPGLGMPLRALGLWLLADLVLTFLLSWAGFRLLNAARGAPGTENVPSAARQAAASLPAYLVIRFLNPFSYVSALFDTVPAAWRERRRGRKTPGGVVWERPRGVRYLSWRTRGVMVSVLAVYPLLTGMVVAPKLFPVNAAAWELVHSPGRLSLEEYMGGTPVLWPAAAGSPAVCRSGAAPAGHRFAETGDAAAYSPLGLWDLLTMARLAPLLPLIGHAAAEYGVDVNDLLLVFMNESLFDPLAEGPTGDFGLAQLTGDALTLLHAVSRDPASPAYGPSLVTDDSSVFDPLFSACAGAAKLAWAWSQPGVTDLSEAYALYINPTHGFVGGRIGSTWQPLVTQLDTLRPGLARIAAAFARYETEPGALTESEAALVETSRAVAAGTSDMRMAYEQSRAVVVRERIDDRDMYDRVLTRLYGPALAQHAD